MRLCLYGAHLAERVDRLFAFYRSKWSRSGRPVCPDPLKAHRVFPRLGSAAAYRVFVDARERNRRNRGARAPRDKVLQRRGYRPNANDPTADPQAAAAKSKTLEVAPHGRLPAEARRLHPCVHNDTEETELGHA